MEDVTVEVEGEDDLHDVQDLPVENVSWFDSNIVITYVVTYGWFLVLGSILMLVVWWKFIRPCYEKWLDDRHAAQYHKDPDLALSRMRAVEAARQRLQAEHDAAAAAYAVKVRQREEEKRQEKVETWNNSTNSGRIPSRNPSTLHQDNSAAVLARKTTGKPKLRNDDYNPLMGHGGSRGYRPSPRSCGGGGGGGGA